MRSQTQEAKKSFLLRVAGIPLRNRERSSVIWRNLYVDMLLFSIKGSQLRFRLLGKSKLEETQENIQNSVKCLESEQVSL